MPGTSQSVTKPSDTGSVQQTTFSPYHSWSVGGRNHYFCSLQGILRIIEIVLVLIVLIIARVGAKVTCSGGDWVLSEDSLCPGLPTLLRIY